MREGGFEHDGGTSFGTAQSRLQRHRCPRLSATSCWVVLLLLLLSGTLRNVLANEDDDVAGPVVVLPEPSGNATVHEEKGGFEHIADAVSETAKEIAREVDQALTKEFGNGTAPEAEGKSYAAALATQSQNAKDGKPPAAGGEDVQIETVVHISGSGSAPSSGSSGTAGTSAVSKGGSGASQPEPGGAPAPSSALEVHVPSAAALEAAEKGVDRIIDRHDNEFVLSKPSSEVAVLTVDPQLIMDVTVVLSSAAVLGAFFEALGQPTINGYLVAGAVIGPGGLKLVKELVQVESVAQLGVFLLLFGLGMELNLAKVRSVLGVSVLGGSLQILVAMVVGGIVSAWMCESPVSAGAFTGALLAMSSTTVVVKSLEAIKSLTSSYGIVTVGTLILQDCWVGLLFALLPVFKPFAPLHAFPPPAGALAPGSDAAAAAALAVSAYQAETDAELLQRTALVAMAVTKVVLKIMLLGGLSLLLARVVLSHLLRLLIRRGSTELTQLVLVGFCLTCTWFGGKAGISEELGAFLGGVMVSVAATGVAAAAAASASTLSSAGSDDIESPSAPLLPGNVNGGGGDAKSHASLASCSSPSVASNPLGHTLGSGYGSLMVAEELQHALRQKIDSVHNVLTTLFLASTALIISPRFLLQHARVLAIGTCLVMALKAALVTASVCAFGYSWRVALAVGVTMAHVGEFAFVLLSAAADYSILPPQVYQLLLGVTALSLLATPLLVIACSRLLKDAPPPPRLAASPPRLPANHGAVGGGGAASAIQGLPAVLLSHLTAGNVAVKAHAHAHAVSDGEEPTRKRKQERKAEP